MHEIKTLESNGVDRVCSLRKIPTRLCGTNFCTSSARFAPSFVRELNGPECTQIVQNASKHQFTVQWGGSDELLRKILTRLHGTNFYTTLARFGPSFVRQPKSTKCTQIVQNAPKHEFRSQGVNSVCSLRKIMTRLRGTNFSTTSARFALSFVRQPNDAKHPKSTKHTKT